MDSGTKRSIDAGRPFLLPAPALVPDLPPCGHGVLVDARCDAGSDAPAKTITLLLRAAEQLEGHSVRADGKPVTAMLSLSTGRCTPRGERARTFLQEHPWLHDALAERLDWLRERSRRTDAQRDRETSCRVALDAAQPGSMIPYDTLFPADWDLVVVHAGETYWAIDHHCVKPSCPCGDIVVEFQLLDPPEARHVGEARLDLQRQDSRPKASTPLAAELFDRLWGKHRDELVRRRDEVRRAVAARAAARPLVVGATVEAPRPVVARGAPCPCGSGKKYKRCCADRDVAATAVAARTRAARA